MANTKRAKLAELLPAYPRIGPEEFSVLMQMLHPISESYLRKLLRESGVALSAMVNGVRQSNLEELQSTLIALLAEYEAGDPAHRMAVRKLVITAKDHAKWTHRAENLLWLSTWLENPPLFPAWAGLRRSTTAVTQPPEL